jgi:acylphosphatase/gas vesicle protein
LNATTLFYGLSGLQVKPLRAVRLRIAGRVQRVGYRRYVLDKAQELGVAGFIENLEDGTVRLFVQAEDEVLEQFLQAVRNPPPPAIVRSVEERPARPDRKLKSFRIKYGRLADELQEGFGSMQSVFMQYWDEFRDYRREFKEYREAFREFAKRTDENFRQILDRYGEISTKLTEISERLTRLMEAFAEETKRSRENFEVLMRESAESREKLSTAIELLRLTVEKLGIRAGNPSG